MPRTHKGRGAGRVAAGLLAVALGAGCAPRAPAEPRGSDAVGGRLLVTFEDGLSSTFLLVRAEVALDGVPLWTCHDPQRSLDAREPVLVHDGPVTGGGHRLECGACARQSVSDGHPQRLQKPTVPRPADNYSPSSPAQRNPNHGMAPAATPWR